MSRPLNQIEKAQLRAMIARTSLEVVAKASGLVMPQLPPNETTPHEPIGVGQCRVCGHYGSDCTGNKPSRKEY